jgi:Right handed beta helix region
VNKLRLFIFIGVAVILAAICTTAEAQSRVFVSGLGDDLNPCTRTAPCRNFQRGHDVVAAGGEVVALDSAGYGAVTITKSVTLDGAGQHAGIAASSDNAITVDAASAKVVLRGLTLNNSSLALRGINATAVGRLHIEGCIVNGFLFTGIEVALSAGGSEIYIKDTIVRNGSAGIAIETSTGTVTASINNCRAESNSNHGFKADAGARVTVSHSVAAGNAGSGFFLNSDVSGATAEMNADHCVASSNNLAGFRVDSGDGGTATMRVARSTATNNSRGFEQSGTSTFASLGDNLVRGNGMNTDGMITVVSGT